VRCLVSGRVQGVWYRSTTAREARRLNLRGWAKNLTDGRVEVVAVGPQRAVQELCGWLWEGPEGAQVSGVTVEEWIGTVGSEFKTL